MLSAPEHDTDESILSQPGPVHDRDPERRAVTPRPSGGYISLPLSLSLSKPNSRVVKPATN